MEHFKRLSHTYQFLLHQLVYIKKELDVAHKQIELAQDVFERNVNQELTEQSEKLNRVMLIFTTVTVLFMPP